MFTIDKRLGNKRIGTLRTRKGAVHTPFFMPDATKGFLRSVGNDDLARIGMGPMVVNTYHLYLQPGMEHIRRSNGIHGFMNWDKPLLSDSGGYQVFSLVHKNAAMGKITENEVLFRSPIDGSRHVITPERSIQIQFDLGVDMMVCFDDPPPNYYSKDKISRAVDRTLRWAERCKREYERQVQGRGMTDADRPLIFGVVQGGMHLDLRGRCAEGLVGIGFDGYGFGARHLDEKGNFLGEVLAYTASVIPADSLRFALGVGTPEDIVRCFSYGWDMFDCVIPTREGRHGRLFVWNEDVEEKLRVLMEEPASSQTGEKRDQTGFYQTININNERFKEDYSPVDPTCDCLLCTGHTRSYVRYMFQMKEPLAMRLASVHNLRFYLRLMEKLRSTS